MNACRMWIAVYCCEPVVSATLYPVIKPNTASSASTRRITSSWLKLAASVHSDGVWCQRSIQASVAARALDQGPMPRRRPTWCYTGREKQYAKTCGCAAVACRCSLDEQPYGTWHDSIAPWSADARLGHS